MFGRSGSGSIFSAGIQWRDLPERSAMKIVHQRFGRWAKSGVFDTRFHAVGERSRGQRKI